MSSVISAGTSTGSALNFTGDTSGSLALATNNGVTAVTIDTSQNVGIGITTPSVQLHQYLASGTTYRQIGNGVHNVTEYVSTAVSAAVYGTTSNIPLLFTTNNAERVRIDTSGNVGIGTTTATQKLEVSGIVLSNGTTNGLRVAKGSTGYYGGFSVDYNGGSTQVETYIDSIAGASWTSSIIFRNANNGGSATERMRIDSNGNVLVAGAPNPSTSRFSLIPQVTEAISIPIASGQSLANIRFQNSSNSTIGYIQWSGSSTTYNTSSDYRLKENIAPMTGALGVVSQLKPVTYNWKVDGSLGQGFIAHELQEVIPDCVTGEKDAVDSEGNPEYQGIDTSFLVATLTAAIQELKQIVDTQATEIAALKAKVGA